ncbi:MAG TPA: RagB/SusD family nutrient uptake outer membrane protein [Puia sp.]|jgi:hypothetical protein
MKRPFINTFLASLVVFALGGNSVSCKKFVEVPPPGDQLNSELVFADSATATSAITGMYGDMMTTGNLFTNMSTTIYAGMSADELYSFTPSLKDEFFEDQITQANHVNINNSFWLPSYKYIYTANLAIEKLSGTTLLSTALRNQLMGEALMVRAFCYFYLVNLFSDVPLVTGTDYNQNGAIPRTRSGEVYQQIITDLKNAEGLLAADYPSAERVRPNKWTATALLSRTYLYTGQWQEAESAADSIINSGAYSLEPDLNNVFLKGSNETIWQLEPVRPGFNTFEGQSILPFNANTRPTYIFNNSVSDAFETGDLRKDAWTQTRLFAGQTLSYPYKYKVYKGDDLSEYYVVLRLAEQYLIRAEARMQLQKFSAARSDINIIRNRAGLDDTGASDLPSLESAIEQERKIELLAEWGHRWFDLKRTGRADPVLAPFKGSTWQSTDVLWPIPQEQINLNPLLIQNPGY